MTTLPNLITHFINYLNTNHLSPQTIRAYKSDVSRYLDWIAKQQSGVGATFTVARMLTKESIEKYLNHLADSSSPASPKGGSLPSTILRKKKSLTRFSTWFSHPSSLVSPPTPLPSADNLIKYFINYLNTNHLSPQTIRAYKSDITRYLRWAEQELPRAELVEVLTKESIEKYLNHLADSSSPASPKGGSLPSTILRKKKSLTRFSTWSFKTYSPTPQPDSDPHSRSEGLPPASPAGGHSGSASSPGSVLHPPKEFRTLRQRVFGTSVGTNVSSPGSVPSPHSGSASSLVPNLASASVRNFATLIILLLFISSLALFAYRQFSRDATLTSAYPSTAITPNRQLSFQGRLENAAGTPVTTATDLTFKLWDALTVGNQLYTTGTCSITPDSDGVFNTQIGGTCGSAIDATVFTENSDVWLEVTVVAETLTPRQPIATVAYALNAETLQGFPLSSTISALRNTVVPMNQYGEVILGEQSPRLTGVSGTFAISAPSLSLTSTSGQINLTGNTVVTGDLTFAGIGDDITFTNLGKIDNDTDGIILLTATTAKSSGNLYVGTSGTGTITSGLINSQTISSTANFTGTVGITTSVSSPIYTGAGAVALTAGGTGQALTLDAATSGPINIGNTSTGDILLGGGVGDTGCTVANATGTLTCTTGISASSIPFSGITSGTNTIAAMLVGTGASLGYTGSGTIDASSLTGATWAAPGSIGSGTPNSGAFTTLTTTSTASVSGILTLGNGATNTLRSAYGPLNLAYKSGLNTWATGLTLQDTTGNVGIGTTAPTTGLLDVRGIIKTTSSFFAETGGSDQGSSGSLWTDGGPNYATTLAGYNLAFNTGDNDARTTNMYIDTTGLIGIGTTAPASKLDIKYSSASSDILTVGLNDTTDLKRVTLGTESWYGALKIYDDSNNLTVKLLGGGADNYLNSGSLGIGTTSPAATALLDLTSTTQGFLAPRMTGTQRDAISTPATGLMIYNTDTNQYNVFNGSTWGAVGGGGGAWSDLTIPTANLSLAHAGYTTAFTFDSLTTADAFALSSSSLTTGTLFDLSSTSTAGGASGTSKLLDLTRSGINSNSSHTAYGLYSAVTNTGTTSTNVGGYFSASGATNNYGLIIENGSVGLGNTTPVGKLDVSGAVTGKALAIFNETGDQDILTASASGVTRFRVATDGYVYAQRFADTASSSYYLDPAATGTSLMVDGNLVSDGAFSITSNATDGNITLDAGSGTVLIGTSGAGKLDAGTIDPPYTINGDKFATYMAGMTGVKEETTGVVQATEFVPGSGYRATLDFAGSLTGSDLWLFSKTSNLQNNLDKMVVLLSASGSGKSWYQLDAGAGKLYLYSQSPTTISYRLTAPRFDANSWANTRGDDSESLGFVINDENAWSVPESLASLFSAPSSDLFSPLASDSAITITAPVVIRPTLQGSSLSDMPALIVEGEIDAATISARVAKLQDIQADTITARNIVADTISANHIEGLDAKIASLSAGLSDSEFESITDRIKARLALLTGNAATATDIPAPIAPEGVSLPNYEGDSLKVATNSATLASASIDFATINDYLAVIGQATITTLDVTANLYTNSIQSKCDPLQPNDYNLQLPCSSTLALQPLGGIINLASGTLIVDSSGQVAINGNLTVSGKILAQSAELATLSLGTPSSATDSALGQLLQIYDEAGEAVATIDKLGNLAVSGDLTASGSANLAQLSTNLITISTARDASASATISSLLSSSISKSATAGVASITSPGTQLTIGSPYITPNSLVYLTPTGNTEGRVLYVKSKNSCDSDLQPNDYNLIPPCTPSFTVALDAPARSDISFNWWIIELNP